MLLAVVASTTPGIETPFAKSIAPFSMNFTGRDGLTLGGSVPGCVVTGELATHSRWNTKEMAAPFSR